MPHIDINKIKKQDLSELIQIRQVIQEILICD